MTKYLLYDSRANADKDDAVCYSSCDSLKEALKEKKEDFPDAVIFREEMRHVEGNKWEAIKSTRIVF